MELKKISEKTYEEFAKGCSEALFLNSSAWAKFRTTVNWSYECLGLYYDDYLQGACIVQVKQNKKTRVKIAYVPGGYLLDYSDFDLLDVFTKKLRVYLKKLGVMCLKIDPQVTLQFRGNNFEVINKDAYGHIVFDNLLDCGYKHLGFLDHFEGMQPRHTTRVKTKDCSYEMIVKGFEKQTRNLSKIGIDKGLVLVTQTSGSVLDFVELLDVAAKRNNFSHRDIKYYQNLFDQFGDDAVILYAVVDFKHASSLNKDEYKKLVDEQVKLKDKLTCINDVSSKKYRKLINKLDELEVRIVKNRKLYKEIISNMQLYPDGIKIAGSFYVVHNNKMHYLYAGTSNIFREYMPSYFLVNHMLEIAVNKGYDYFDTFGISGDISPDNPDLGLYTFKKGFGGDVIEYIGEFDLPIKKGQYFIFTKVYPIIKKLRKRR